VFLYELAQVSKEYSLGDRAVPVLKNIDLQIKKGEFVSIVGPSGSGKSTLMQLLGCLDIPSSGVLRIGEHDVLALSDDQLASLRCRTIGFVFQSFHLLPSYDAVSNVSLASTYRGLPQGRERALQLLKDLGLGHRLHHKPNTLSGGEKQRVAIARAMINNPEVLLADEPTGSLDQQNGQMILDLLEQFHRQGKTIILVTHDSHIAARAHRLIEIVDGQIQTDHG